MRLLLIAAVMSGVAAASASASPALVRWFNSPSGNISCEVGANRPELGTYAYCATVSPPHCVRLTRSGHMSVHRGAICLGNPPDNAFTLAYGRSVRVGPFRCTSRRDGIRCLVARTGRGFLINRAGVHRL